MTGFRRVLFRSRLWHKDMISVLPNNMVLDLWKDIRTLQKSMQRHHRIDYVNSRRLLEYKPSHFLAYTILVTKELSRRGIKPKQKSLDDFIDWIKSTGAFDTPVSDNLLLIHWHNDRYLKQCYYACQELYDCGVLTQEQLSPIRELAHKGAW